MNINGLKSNDKDKKTIGKFVSKSIFRLNENQFRLDVDIRKTRQEPIFQEFIKSIFEVEWINRDDSSIILLQMTGVKSRKESSFYVELSSHPHIIHIYGIVPSNPGSIVLLQECSPHGNLSSLLRKNEFKPSERVLWNIFKQICDGMIYLLDNNIIHGDLICQNIIIFQMDSINPNKNLIKLTDFGLTNVSKLYSFVDKSILRTMINVRTRYVAPELLKNAKILEYSEKSDIYSMGVLMWEASSFGQFPYSNIEDNQIIRQKKLKDDKLSQPSLCSDRLWTIIKQCWEQQPKNRPNFQSLMELLSNLQSKSIIKCARDINTDINLDRSIISSEVNNADLRYFDNDDEKEEDDISNRNNEEYDNDSKDVDSHEKIFIPIGCRSCPFCQECFLSSVDVRDHLIQCGTKIDQCPNCQKFLPRSIFGYHYENNCIDMNGIEVFNPLNNPDTNRICLFLPSKSNENNDSTQSNILKCEFCDNQCLENDYEIHKDHCLTNPANRNKILLRRLGQSRIVEDHPSNKFRLIPCEHCQEEFSDEELRSHKKSCLKNVNSRSSSSSRSVHSTTLSKATDEEERYLLSNKSDCHWCCCCS